MFNCISNFFGMAKNNRHQIDLESPVFITASPLVSEKIQTFPFATLRAEIKKKILESLTSKELYTHVRGLDKNWQREAILELCSRKDQESINYQLCIFSEINTPFFEENQIKKLEIQLNKRVKSPFSSVFHQLGAQLFIAKLRKDPAASLHLSLPTISKLYAGYPSQTEMRILCAYADNATQDALFECFSSDHRQFKKKGLEYLSVLFSYINDEDKRQELLTLLLNNLTDNSNSDIKSNAALALVKCLPHIRNELTYRILRNKLISVFFKEKKIALLFAASLFPYLEDEVDRQQVIKEIYESSSRSSLGVTSHHRSCYEAIASIFPFLKDKNERQKMLKHLWGNSKNTYEQYIRIKNLITCIPYTDNEERLIIINYLFALIKQHELRSSDYRDVVTALGACLPYSNQEERQTLFEYFEQIFKGENRDRRYTATVCAVANYLPYLDNSHRQMLYKQLRTQNFLNLSHPDTNKAIVALAKIFSYMEEIDRKILLEQLHDSLKKDKYYEHLDAIKCLAAYLPFIESEKYQTLFETLRLEDFFIAKYIRSIAGEALATCFSYMKEESRRKILSTLDFTDMVYGDKAFLMWRTIRSFIHYANLEEHELLYNAVEDIQSKIHNKDPAHLAEIAETLAYLEIKKMTLSTQKNLATPTISTTFKTP